MLDLDPIRARAAQRERLYASGEKGGYYPAAEDSARDVPALIAEVEQLRIDLERLQRLYHMAVDDAHPGGAVDA